MGDEIREPEEGREFTEPTENKFSKERNERRGTIDQILEGLGSGDISQEAALDALDEIAERESLIEPKTKLLNQKGLNLQLYEAMTTADRVKVPLTLLYIDGNKFKRINDTLGHDKGDIVRDAIADAIKHSIRKSDIPSRISEEDESYEHAQGVRHGGDEFALILQGTSIEGSIVLARKLQAATSNLVNERLPEHKRTFGEDFIISIGVADFNPNEDLELGVNQEDVTPEIIENAPLSIIKRAENAMYSAKAKEGPDIIGFALYVPQTDSYQLGVAKDFKQPLAT